MTTDPSFRRLFTYREKIAFREHLRLSTEKLNRSRIEFLFATTEHQLNVLFWYSFILYGKIECVLQLIIIEKTQWTEEMELIKQEINRLFIYLSEQEDEYETELLPYIYLPN